MQFCVKFSLLFHFHSHLTNTILFKFLDLSSVADSATLRSVIRLLLEAQCQNSVMADLCSVLAVSLVGFR